MPIHGIPRRRRVTALECRHDRLVFLLGHVKVAHGSTVVHTGDLRVHVLSLIGSRQALVVG